jgi:predicted aldo/keto reductase-like oxidoreductase
MGFAFGLSQSTGWSLTLFVLFIPHNTQHTQWITRKGGCLEVIREYQAAGRIKFIGFSTHGMTPLIVKAIETGIFDYVNLHHHFMYVNE